MLRVVVVDDSHVARGLLTGILNGEADIEVVGEAVNGLQAVAMVAELRPDVVTMDVQMPRMDGYTATREIMTSCPVPIVVVSGSAGHEDLDKSMQSLDAGALAVIGKPPSPASRNFETAVRSLLNTVRSMAAVRVIRRHRPRPAPETNTTQPSDPRTANRLPKSRPRIVTIGASTGGPQALRTIFTSLPPDFPVPIIVVQHISIGFTQSLADWLQKTVDLNVCVARHGDIPQHGHVYLAPDASHCEVQPDGTLALTSRPPLGGFQPSATVLFETAADAYGPSHIAVILTGMGKDGVDGLPSVGKTGGLVIAQDEESSVVFGMPKGAIDAGLADLILPLENIGAELMRLTASQESSA